MKRAIFPLLLVLGLPAAADDAPILTYTHIRPPSMPAIPKGLLAANAKLGAALPAVAPAPAQANANFNVNGKQVIVQQVVRRGGMIRVFGGFVQMGGNGPPPSDSVAVPTLRWKNGETLGGDITGASAGDLTWKSTLFQDPLELRWGVIDRIDWPKASVQPKEPFSIALRDGSFIYGDLVSVDVDSITIHGARHGDAVLKRSEVLSVRRLQHGSLLYSGPTGDVGWQPVFGMQNGNMATSPFGTEIVAPLATGPDGALEIRSWNRGGRMDITLPDLADVEFSLRTSKRPDFMLSLGGTPHATVRIETWDDELVLAMGEQFKVIRKINDDEREVNLRVCWNKTTQKCQVFTAAGDLITEWQVPGNISSTAPGLVLLNKGLDLSLNFLRVREWDGKPPAKIDPKQLHLELADGRCVAGQIAPGAAGTIHLLTAGQTAAVDFPISNVDALVFSPDQPQVAPHEATFSYNDGSILFGNLVSIANGSATITTSFTEKPLSSQLNLLRQVHVRLPVPAGAQPDKPLAEQDKIVVEGTTLHGKLGTVGDDSPGWIPIGGLKAAKPSLSLPSEITRYIPPNTPAPNDQALFYLSSGDILPGNLGSLDRSGAEFESRLMAARKIPAEELEAIKLGTSGGLNVQGFGDPGWQIIRGDDGTVQRENGGLQMASGTSIFYPSLMQGSEISFKYLSNGFSAARLRMFCSKKDPTRATNLLLGCTGNQFISGLEATEGQFDNQDQIKMNPGEPVAVRLEIGEDEVELFVNDVSQQHIPIDPAKRSGLGLMIEPAGLWGNNNVSISLSDFTAHSGPGHSWQPDVSDDIKTQVLTVPRFEKDDPPQHLLLAGNGDVLRGEIEAATATHFGFRSGLENLDVPRDRVDAVIWLKPPEANSPAVDPAEKPAPSLLDQRLQVRMMFREVGLPQLISFLQSQVEGLKIKLPETMDSRMVQMQFGGQTVGETLGMICARFNLSYHVDTDGTIILETGRPPQTADFVAKTYWLKPGAIPGTASAQEILTAKGITFPKGSSVQWRPNGGLLSMLNTTDNQDRLATLLVSDFGGSLGSPTCWLQLVGGARLTFTVDKIDRDFITGHHPDYGPVKVPMSEVYAIRTTAPPTSPAMKALENWRLVNAPEPVLPEGSGESSPLLGKSAASFELPLLAGGNFNLDEQKGQIVVLDFWATWCAPCIQSLPGLIDAVASFPADRVKFIGVNQGEAAAQVTHFLETRGLKFAVALDADQAVGQKYGADSIPQTVIVGPDGKVAWVQTGYSADEDSEASDVVKQLLAKSSADKTSGGQATP